MLIPRILSKVHEEDVVRVGSNGRGRRRHLPLRSDAERLLLSACEQELVIQRLRPEVLHLLLIRMSGHNRAGLIRPSGFNMKAQ